MKMLNEHDLRKKVKVLIGGAAANAAFTEEIGSDGWGADTSEAITMVGEWMKQKKEVR
ncbi:MAG: hypothetical protein H5T33_06870 [Candidatus Methanosuratus sp.]|nr:hypothetical protein [Candidatus Methanosuratincola sp.]